MKELPQRKPNRLQSFDYSAPHAYFITICTKDRVPLLGNIVGASSARPPYCDLSPYGYAVKQAVLCITDHYPAVVNEKYVIMPNHLHLLLRICADEHGRALLAPTISHIIQHLKGVVTKELGFSIWQKSFHDHIVRNEHDYQMIWQYIDNNPSQWESDCFYNLKQHDE